MLEGHRSVSAESTRGGKKSDWLLEKKNRKKQGERQKREVGFQVIKHQSKHIRTKRKQGSWTDCNCNKCGKIKG